MKTTDIIWLAGLLEGEGCFGYSGSKNGSLRVSLVMTDFDVVEKAANILGSTVRNNKLQPNRKQSYSTAVYSGIAAGWMMTLYQFMGERRKAKIEEGLNKWKSQKVKNKSGYGRKNPRSKGEIRHNEYLLSLRNDQSSFA